MELMFPKKTGKKPRKVHPPSILQKKDGTCYLCMKLNDNYCRYRLTHLIHSRSVRPPAQKTNNTHIHMDTVMQAA